MGVDLSLLVGVVGLSLPMGEIGLSLLLGEVGLSLLVGEVGLSLPVGEVRLSLPVGVVGLSLQVGVVDLSLWEGVVDLSLLDKCCVDIPEMSLACEWKHMRVVVDGVGSMVSGCELEGTDTGMVGVVWGIWLEVGGAYEAGQFILAPYFPRV